MMSTRRSSKRRHAAAHSRVATALLSAGGFLAIIGALAATRTAASTPATSTASPTVPAPAQTTVPAPAQTTAPATSSNRSPYAGTPAPIFNQQPVTRSHASR